MATMDLQYEDTSSGVREFLLAELDPNVVPREKIMNAVIIPDSYCHGVCLVKDVVESDDGSDLLVELANEHNEIVSR